ncbi:flagellar basal-body rod protein FlgF [Marinimicrobium sp. ARAG 43.8]|uniref:flagellar basal-body rod protein FlgF n=1 Tax=Marinimicrobium sp. ARAG 43.8 TaxID=3418719 RepID=UPI003CF50027
MDKALYVAMTGAKNNMLAQTNHSNNLANLNTTGFRADFAQARSMPIYYGDGHPSRAYALTERPATNFQPGPMNETGRDLDIAVQGEGFIAVQAPDGTEAYTRAGGLHVDPLGILRNGSGLPVMGNEGPVALPPMEKMEIGSDGTISVVAQGLGPEAMVEVDRIKLVNPGAEALSKGEDGLFRQDNNIPAPADAGVSVLTGFLEGSNVNAVEEFTQILSQSRQYEMQVKVMQTARQNSETSARLLQN